MNGRVGIIGRIRQWFGSRKAQMREAEAAIEAADYRVLFVCMGNICRSPTVEGVFRRVADRDLAGFSIAVDSAGTHAYHVGQPPDQRAQAAASRRGIDLSSLRARRIAPEDFGRFDLIVAMDQLNVAVLMEECPEEYTGRIRLLLDFAEDAGREDVPDPYYGGSKGFEYVLDLAEGAAVGLATHIRGELGRR